MEKSFQLDQKEITLLGQLDQERTQALAMVGALLLDLEQAKKNLDTAGERQRACVRQALTNRSVDRFDNARVQNGALLVTLPDQNPLAAGSEVMRVERPNGQKTIDVVKE